jgi:hypothetical protein
LKTAQKAFLVCSFIAANLLVLGCGGGGGSEPSQGVSSSTPSSSSVSSSLSSSSAGSNSSVTSTGVGVDRSVCNSATIEGAVKYVSLSGDDATADGSQEHPYRSVFQAVADAQSGDTVLVRGGTYVEPHEIRVRVPSVSIRSFAGEWAVIDRSASTQAEDGDSGIYLDVDSDNSHIACLEVIGGYYNISTETRWDWGEADRSGPENIRLEHLKVHGSYADAIKIKPNSDHLSIEHCEIYNTGVGQSEEECNAEGIDNVNADATQVRYTYIHNTCSTGVYFKGGAQDCVVEHCVIENTGEAGILLGFDTSPEYFDLDANPEYYEAIRPIARYNLVRNAGGAGIGLFASKDANVSFNTIIDTSARFHAPLYFGITYQDWEAQAGRPANINPTLSNNIVAQINRQNIDLVSIRHTDDLGGLDGLSGSAMLDQNCYYQAGGAAHFFDGRGATWEGGFNLWQQHIASDANSLEINPQFDAHYMPTESLCQNKGYQGL